MIAQNILQNKLKPFISCKDFTVSHETFDLYRNENYHLLLTQPVPENLDAYYESEAYISHTNSNKTLLEKVYQLVRNYTLQKKVVLINSFNTSKKTILDVGAGTGDFLVQCQKNGWEAVGVEPNKTAQKIALENGVSLEDDIFSFSEKQFDVISLWHVLEHVPNLQDYIIQLKKLLKPNGVLLIAVPNFNSFDANYYKEFWAAYDVPRHLWHFSQTAIKKLFNEVDMKVIQTKPMKFDSYYVSLLSEKYKHKSMNPIKAFYIGFLSNFKARKTSEYSSLIYVLKNTKN